MSLSSTTPTKRGLFWVLEGGEGTGKTLQRDRLAAYLRGRRRSVGITREPGGSPGAEEIRRLVVAGAGDRWSAKAELLLFNAARVDHLERTILPALARGDDVVCDRFLASTVSYQSVARGLPVALIQGLHRDFCDDIRPDLVLLLDLDPEIGLARARARLQASAGAAAPGSDEDRFEGFDLAFHRRLRQAYLRQAAADPAGFAVIDAAADPDGVAAAIASAVDARIAY